MKMLMRISVEAGCGEISRGHRKSKSMEEERERFREIKQLKFILPSIPELELEC